MLGLYQFHHLAVNFFLRGFGAGKGSVPAQILVVHCLHGHHVEVVAHAVAGDHGTRQFCGLFDIVGRAGGDLSKDHFFCGPSACEGGDLIFQLLPGQQVLVAGVHLHGVSQCTGGAGNDRDLLDRSRVRLQRGNQCVADFVIGDDQLFFVG